MKFLLLEKENPGSKAEDFTPHLKAEAAHVWQLQQTGIVREVYFTADEHTAVLMLECESGQDVEGLVAEFPLVKAGLITFEVIALKPYDGFARLFKGV